MGLQLFDALDRDWAVLVASVAAHTGVSRWASDPTLGAFSDLVSLVGTLRDGASPEQANQILSALIGRAATDDLAARTVLQALIPGLVNVTKRLGRGRVDEDLQAQVVTEAIERIRRYPLARRPRAIAANVIRDVLGRICRSRSEDPEAIEAGPVEPLPDPSVEVCELVREALESGRLSRCAAELLLSVAIGNDTLTRRAAREGLTYAAMHERWRRARNRLRDVHVAQDFASHVPSMQPRADELHGEEREP